MTRQETIEINKDYFKKRDKLEVAIKSGAILKIKYMGGSNPGGVREICPLSFEWDHKITALNLKDNIEKTFYVYKISFVSDDQYRIFDKIERSRDKTEKNLNGCAIVTVAFILIVAFYYSFKVVKFVFTDDEISVKKYSITSTY